MGVDYYRCDACKEVTNDCMTNKTCKRCDKFFCYDCLCNSGNKCLKQRWGDVKNMGCVFCAKVACLRTGRTGGFIFSNSDMVTFLLERLGNESLADAEEKLLRKKIAEGAMIDEEICCRCRQKKPTDGTAIDADDWNLAEYDGYCWKCHVELHPEDADAVAEAEPPSKRQKGSAED